MNCYEILGVERGATSEQIRAAFRLRSHMFHPDKYENYPEPLRGQLKAEAEKEFKKLTLAYDTLRDPGLRSAHDRQLDSASARAGGVATAVGRRARTARSATTTRRAPREARVAEGEAEDTQAAAGERNGPHVRGTEGRTTWEAPRPRVLYGRSRDPLLVVRPQRLDFGAVQHGESKQLALKIGNAGGRTLFGEISSNRSWLTVSRNSFISSSVFVFVSVNTQHLVPGQEYTGTIIVTTLNGGDQVVPVSVRVAGAMAPAAAVTPDALEFGAARPGQFKTRTVRVVNRGAGTLVGSIAVKGGWLSVSESRFRGNRVGFEVIAHTAGLPPGTHTGQIEVYTNGGVLAIPASIDLTEDGV